MIFFFPFVVHFFFFFRFKDVSTSKKTKSLFSVKEKKKKKQNARHLRSSSAGNCVARVELLCSSKNLLESGDAGKSSTILFWPTTTIERFFFFFFFHRKGVSKRWQARLQARPSGCWPTWRTDAGESGVLFEMKDRIRIAIRTMGEFSFFFSFTIAVVDVVVFSFFLFFSFLHLLRKN